MSPTSALGLTPKSLSIAGAESWFCPGRQTARQSSACEGQVQIASNWPATMFWRYLLAHTNIRSEARRQRKQDLMPAEIMFSKPSHASGQRHRSLIALVNPFPSVWHSLIGTCLKEAAAVQDLQANLTCMQNFHHARGKVEQRGIVLPGRLSSAVVCLILSRVRHPWPTCWQPIYLLLPMQTRSSFSQSYCHPLPFPGHQSLLDQSQAWLGRQTCLIVLARFPWWSAIVRSWHPSLGKLCQTASGYICYTEYSLPSSQCLMSLDRFNAASLLRILTLYATLLEPECDITSWTWFMSA